MLVTQRKMKKMKSRSSNFFIPQRHLDVVSLLRDGVLWRDAAVLCSLQGEDQAGVLHVQPHVWRNGEEEPDEAGGGLLRAGGFLVHQTDQVRPDFTFPPCCHLLAVRTGLGDRLAGVLITSFSFRPGPGAACRRSGTSRIPKTWVKPRCAPT